jgi:hypothetical protein
MAKTPLKSSRSLFTDENRQPALIPPPYQHSFADSREKRYYNNYLDQSRFFKVVQQFFIPDDRIHAPAELDGYCRTADRDCIERHILRDDRTCADEPSGQNGRLEQGDKANYSAWSSHVFSMNSKGFFSQRAKIDAAPITAKIIKIGSTGHVKRA